ncbi:MAG: amidohydrolase family protein [Bacteroidetes bacterium]|nr:amidohydrolase family protein [Bacteroidales bacterium]NJO68806.1 amidohydrolase family protein [Bacteroidota bacterium]
MKIDSHQHFWKYNPLEFGWINEQMHVIRQNFLPNDLQEVLNQTGYQGSVAVQARQNTEETAWLLELSANHNFICGVVGWVDLCSPKLVMQLDEFSKYEKFVGVRHVIHDEPDIDFMLRAEFLKGISLIGKYNLTYDILVFPKHLANTIQLVKLFPDQVFILDHIAKPDIKNQLLSPWKEDIQKLATYPNVFCKVSGMVTEANWNSWKQEDFNPYLDVVFENFGSDRVMIGSDWPVCTVAGSYGHVMNIVEDYIQPFSIQEKAAVTGDNAKRLYQLK